MNKIIPVAVIVVMTSACSKVNRSYYCQCTITHTVGSGIYTGVSTVRAKAEADCADKKMEVEADGQTANCEVLENVD